MSRAKRSLARKLAKSRSPAQPGRCGRDIADVIRTSFGSVDAERLDPAVQVAPIDLQQARCAQLAREGAARQLRLQEIDARRAAIVHRARAYTKKRPLPDRKISLVRPRARQALLS